jgi:hypothetical protein
VFFVEDVHRICRRSALDYLENRLSLCGEVERGPKRTIFALIFKKGQHEAHPIIRIISRIWLIFNQKSNLLCCWPNCCKN